MSLEEALADPQTAFNRMIVESEPTAAGPVRLVASPIEMSAAPFAIRHPPPKLDEHHDEVLTELEREVDREDEASTA